MKTKATNLECKKIVDKIYLFFDFVKFAMSKFVSEKNTQIDVEGNW